MLLEEIYDINDFLMKLWMDVFVGNGFENVEGGVLT